MKFGYIILSILLLPLLAGCEREDFDLTFDSDKVEVLPDGRLRIPLKLIAPNPTVVQTRSANTADENSISSIWVTVWEDNNNGGVPNDDAKLLQLARGVINSSNAYVTLKKYDNPCQMRVFVNLSMQSQLIIDAYKTVEDNPTNPTTFGNFKNFSLILAGYYTNYGANQAGGAYTNLNPPFPMSSDRISLQDISEETTNNLEVPLDICAGRIDISTTLSDFTISEATLLNGATKGYLRVNAGLPVNLGNTIQYASVPVKTGNIILPIYLFPNNGAVDGGAQGSNPTYLIVKGQKAGYPLGFYKIAVQYKKQPTDIDYTYDIARNTRYKVSIIKVSGAGYTSFNEAKNNESINIDYNITVDDQGSHDIITNGKYYMGFSNSEYHVYTDNEESKLAVTMTHNAPSSVLRGTVTATGTGLTLLATSDMTPTENTGTFSTNDGQKKQYNIYIAISSTFLEGKLTFRMGDLYKEIIVRRFGALRGSPYELMIDDYAKTNDYVEGSVVLKTDPSDWISFGAKADETTDRKTTIIEHTSAPGKIFAFFKPNQTTSTRSAQFILTRIGDKGRIKVDINQSKTNSFTDIIPEYITPNTYVGAFWKASQQGERLIKIPANAQILGKWRASVFLVEDGDWNYVSSATSETGDIIFSDKRSTDPKVYTANFTSTDMNNSTTDAAYQITGGQSSVSGELALGEHIEFRIGLKSKFNRTEDNGARYAVVLLEYKNLTKAQFIFIRQGEWEDYLMRKTDQLTGFSPLTTRPLAVKFLPYNYTDPKRQTTLNYSLITPQTKQIDETDFNPDKLTGFPTMAGYLMPFGGLLKAVPPLTANVTAFTASLLVPWDPDNETCPVGYRRPKDVDENASYDYSKTDATRSELRQSLWVTPPKGIRTGDAAAFNNGNSVFGYYADGYFDRGIISGNIVNNNTLDVAYIGALMYNPTEGYYASLFFPAAGKRNFSSPFDLQFPAIDGYYLTASVNNRNNGTGNPVNYGNEMTTLGFSRTANTSIPGAGITSWNRDRSINLRCVKR